MRLKKFHRLHAIIHLTGALGTLGLLFVLFLAGAPRVGLAWGLAPVALLLYRFGVNWYKYRKAGECEEVYDVEKRPPEEHIFMWRKALWIALILGPLIGYLTYRDLSAAERGEGPAVKLRVEEAMLYKVFGLWGAVLCWPAITGGFALVALYKIERAKARLETQAGDVNDGRGE